jgi:uncharacterized protein YbjT (DUF2867 family)
VYLVTGASGNIGRELTQILVDGGHPVRALRRSAAEAPHGVEVVVGDLNDPSTLDGPLDGVTGVFLMPGYADMPGVLAACVRRGVERVVLLSSGAAASRDMTNAITAYMVASEDAVTASGLPWTILRPTAFMSNALRWKPQLDRGNVVTLPFADVRTACVDPRDIAAVAATALTADGHAGQVYVPTGPQSLLPSDQVAVLADVLGRPLTAVPQSNDEARAEMLASTPPEYVDAFFDFAVGGALDESRVLPTVRDITGHEPGTFAAWAKRHAPDFAA